MNECGLGERLHREGLRHDGVYLRSMGAASHRHGGADRRTSHYGLRPERGRERPHRAHVTAGGARFTSASRTSRRRSRWPQPRIASRTDGEPLEIACDFIAGCDGFHGVCRDVHSWRTRPHLRARVSVCLARNPRRGAPSSTELVYSLHERGFALFSMRSPTVTRLYLQCAPDEQIAEWPDERIWRELATRLGDRRTAGRPTEGPIVRRA